MTLGQETNLFGKVCRRGTETGKDGMECGVG